MVSVNTKTYERQQRIIGIFIMTEKTKMVKRPVDGIDFYVSEDVTVKGMSKLGLALFSSYSDRNMRRALKVLEYMGSADYKNSEIPVSLEVPKILKSYVDSRTIPEVLEPFVGKGYLVRQVVTQDNAIILSSPFCEAWIYFCAFFAAPDTVDIDNRKNSQKSYRKFAKLGIDKFIVEITGAIDIGSEKRILEAIHLMYEEIKESKEIAREFRALQNNTKTYAPGLKDLNDKYGQEDIDQLCLPCADGAVSADAFLYSKGINDVADSFYRSFCRRIVDAYRTVVKECPEKRHFVRKDGTKQYNVYVYQPIHFPIMERAFEEIMRIYQR